MRIRKKIPKHFLVLFLTIFIILLGFRLTIFDFDFYERQFEENNVYERYGKEIVDKNALELINHLKEGYPLHTDFFNEKEKVHLKDVKIIVDNFLSLFYLSIIFSFFILISLLYKKQHSEIFSSLFFSSICASVILLILFLFSFNFQGFFINFHKAFFSNELWLLNAETDNLISLFPESFFSSALKRIMLIDLIIAIATFVLSFIIRLKTNVPLDK